jgi:hypothetical protein
MLGFDEATGISGRKGYFKGVCQGSREQVPGTATRTDQKEAPSPFLPETRRPHEGLLRLLLPAHYLVQRFAEKGWTRRGEGLRRRRSCEMIDWQSSTHSAQIYTSPGPSTSGPTSVWLFRQNEQ